MAAPAADDVAAASLADAVHVTQKVGKRKRSAEPESAPQTQLARDDTDEDSKQLFERFLRDLLIVLQQHDPTPSILQQSLKSTQDATPSAKRTKLSSRNLLPDTIQSKIAAGRYNNIEELSSDIAAAVAAASVDVDDSIIAKFQVFEQYFNDAVDRQRRQEPIVLPPSSRTKEAAAGDDFIDPLLTLSNGTASSTILQSIGPGGRPYFSSIENIVHSASPQADSNKDKEILETSLPKTVTVAAVGTVRGFDSKTKGQHIPTLGEICPTPKRLPAYKTPQDSSRATTRGTVVSWYKAPQFPPSQPRGEGRVSYSRQRLSVGAWLTANNPPPPPNDTVNERRRQRDRALSAGTQRVEQTANELAEARVAQEKYRRRKDLALFKSVYSSFAPTFDNSRSVVPQEITGRMWWNKKFGDEARYGDSSVEADDDTNTGVGNTHDDIDETTLADAIANFVEDEWSPADATQNGGTTGDEEVDELLRGISDMLETLSSHQRRRHGVLKASSRPALAEIIGTPSTPATSEVEVHTKLRDQLATVISMLPPYAVARLNGDQLSDLNIKTTIPVETVMHRGVLDDETRRAPSTAVAAVTGAALRPQAPTPRSSFQNSIASSALRNSVSTPRQVPAWNATRPMQTPGASYSSFQPTQSSSAPRSNFQFVQSPAPARHASQVNGIRLGPGQPSTGSPMPLQGSQPQRLQQQNLVPRPGQAAGHPVAYSSQGSPQPLRQTYGTPQQISPPRQQATAAQGSFDGTSIPNGVGVTDNQSQASIEVRTKEVELDQNREEAALKPQTSPAKAISPSPQTTSEVPVLSNGHPADQAKGADHAVKAEVAQVTASGPTKEPLIAQINGEPKTSID